MLDLQTVLNSRVPEEFQPSSVSLRRLPVSRQDHHRHPAAAGGGQAAHDEGEVVERERLSGGGE